MEVLPVLLIALGGAFIGGILPLIIEYLNKGERSTLSSSGREAKARLGESRRAAVRSLGTMGSERERLKNLWAGLFVSLLTFLAVIAIVAGLFVGVFFVLTRVT